MEVTLKIKNCDSFVNGYIINWLKRGVASVSDSKYKKMDDYLLNILGVKETSKELLDTAIDNIKIIKKDSSYELKMDKNLYNDDYTLDSLVRLIEFGNLEVRGVRTITTLFEFLRNNARKMYNTYMLERRGHYGN